VAGQIVHDDDIAGRSSGISTLATTVSKASLMIGPSSTHGAMKPRRVSALTKVVVFQ
jgi:hypothetical protein